MKTQRKPMASVMLRAIFLCMVVSSIQTAYGQSESHQVLLFQAAVNQMPPVDASKGIPVGIFSVNSDGTDLKQLTVDDGHLIGYQSPKWSPDGRQVAFSRSIQREGSYRSVLELYAMDRDGANRHLVVSFAKKRDMSSRLSGFAWSPDGTMLAVTKLGANAGLYVVNSDGTKAPHKLVSEQNFSAPSWSPDGTRIAWMQAAVKQEAKPISIVHTVNTAGPGGTNRRSRVRPNI